MKKIIILFFMFTVSMFSYSQDQTSDKNNKKFQKNKTIEISTGISLIDFISLNVRKNEPSSPSFYFSLIAGQSIGVSIPTSFVFYPNSYYGIGCLYQLGTELFLRYGCFPSYLMLINKIKIVNKFGDLNQKKWFLLEIGINLNSLFPFDNNVSPNYIDLINFSFGPSLLLGYEKIFNKNFGFTVGFIFDNLYFHQKETIISEDSNSRNYFSEFDSWNFSLGIEFRFKFDYLYQLKNTKTMSTSDNSR